MTRAPEMPEAKVRDKSLGDDATTDGIAESASPAALGDHTPSASALVPAHEATLEQSREPKETPADPIAEAGWLAAADALLIGGLLNDW